MTSCNQKPRSTVRDHAFSLRCISSHTKKNDLYTYYIYCTSKEYKNVVNLVDTLFFISTMVFLKGLNSFVLFEACASGMYSKWKAKQRKKKALIAKNIKMQ